MNINAPLVCLEPLTAGVLIWKGMGVLVNPICYVCLIQTIIL